MKSFLKLKLCWLEQQPSKEREFLMNSLMNLFVFYSTANDDDAGVGVADGDSVGVGVTAGA